MADFEGILIKKEVKSNEHKQSEVFLPSRRPA